jgi:uncharacterized protein (DUF58 family)
MPAWDEARIQAATKRVRLGVDARRRRLGAGSRLGAGPGASLEFHDHRAYLAGDDLRHLDWSVYARTEQLMLRRHRQEVSPRFEVVLDCSASMALTPAKTALATDIAALLATLAESDGTRPVVWCAGEALRRLPGDWREALRRTACAGSGGLEARPVPTLGAGSERFLVSDGLCPGGGAPVVQALGSGAGRIALVQVLTAAERSPEPLGAARLEDLEGGAGDVLLDVATCDAYRERLARHQAGWQAALSGRGAGLVTCVVEDGFERALATLLQAGVLEPRNG